MIGARWLFLLLIFLLGLSARGSPQAFNILVINAENLFDVDGIARFPDFAPDKYGPGLVLTKVRHIAEIVAAVGDGGAGEVPPGARIAQVPWLQCTPFLSHHSIGWRPANAEGWCFMRGWSCQQGERRRKRWW